MKEVKKKELLQRADVSDAVLNAVIKKGIFRQYKKEINRFAHMINHVSEKPPLSEEQQRAYKEICESYKTKSITLLHGVTSSGKTLIYIHLIDEMLRLGRQVLYLVPEIALTTQLTQRLQVIFGDKLLIYHSKFSDNERVDIWKKLLKSDGPCVVIGVRSAVFLPFSNLGLVIVDEEHDTSYKQQDPAPRYNGRNAAIVLASMHGAKTLLGSATPAVEVYHNAETGRYGLVSLLNRYEGIEMPKVEVIDTREARKKRLMKGMFSDSLVHLCRESLDAGEQVILFQNRRGYSPMVRCKECGWVPKCENCDVSLTYHKHVDPVEKKPLLHFLPGSQCLSIAAAGCNLSCKNCQNWEISQISPSKIGAEKISPADFIRIAKRTHCKSVAYTYTEPLTYMEYTQDCAKLAREYGLRNILVTAGYVNEEPLRELTPYLDAVNVDLKSFDDAIYKEISHAHLAPVLRTLEILRDDNVWIEIINLLIPGVNDDMQMVNSMCHWLINNGFDNYPLHFSRFFPAYKLKNVPPTPEETLIEAKNIACEAGIKFVYIGNIDLDDGEPTHCPS